MFTKLTAELLDLVVHEKGYRLALYASKSGRRRLRRQLLLLLHELSGRGGATGVERLERR